MKVSAVILAGGEGTRLSALTSKRTKPAVPFGGKFRIIDFVLSNCVNSSIFDVMILAQYRPHSLIDHIGAGGPWELDREWAGGVRIYTPYTARGVSTWFRGTADAVQQNFRFIKDRRPDLVLILSGDHIYRMNYRELIDYHLKTKADATLATIAITDEEKSRFGIVQVGEDERVTSFVEKPKEPVPGLGNMGIYVFNFDALNRVLLKDKDLPDSNHDFGKDILPRMVAEGDRVQSWLYRGYWRDVGTVESYWQAHMDLLGDPPLYDLNDLGWLIHTRSENRAPARFAAGASIDDSLITHGCSIGRGAKVIRSILAPGVRVDEGAVIEDSVILTDVHVQANAQIKLSIIDKRVVIGKGAKVGDRKFGEDGHPLLTVVGKSAEIGDGFVLEAGCEVGPDVEPSDFESPFLDSGKEVHSHRSPEELE